MLPLPLYLMLSTKSSTGPPVKRPKLLAIWFVPVIFFLLLWPAIALVQSRVPPSIPPVALRVITDCSCGILQSARRRRRSRRLLSDTYAGCSLQPECAGDAATSSEIFHEALLCLSCRSRSRPRSMC
jgi:hypothetical protein